METVDHLMKAYRGMFLIREFEEQVRRLYAGGAVPGLVHLCSGQEAVCVGACLYLNDDDNIASNHRGHGHCLAKGADPNLLMSEILGRTAGYCGGRSGSLHIFDSKHGNLGTNGIVGGGIPLAVGAALSAKTRGTKQVAICFFGDGALNQGLLYECMNMAAIWRLPVIFICENNGYGEFTAMEDVTAGSDFTARGTALGIPSSINDGMDVLIVAETCQGAIENARAGNGPSFLIFNTYRFGGHHVSDKQSYKTSEEAQLWSRRDPIHRLRSYLLETRHADMRLLDSVQMAVSDEVLGAVAFARASPEPSARDLRGYVFA
jgi:pyruvate dehydrogenase E1 component alpha subunit